MIKKLIDKFFTLTAFISVACLTVHYTPAALIKRTYSFWSADIVYLLFPLMMLASAVLLFLDLFSLKYKNLPNKAWKIFAAIGVVPILPFALFGLICLACSFFNFIVNLF
ncbi:MAG: hypothetical protein SPL52_02400 [Fibrobacter sp.]|nr:hypothetical protein [Fibrobacter sp.]